VASQTRSRPSSVIPAAAAQRQGLRAGVVSRTTVMVIDALAVVVEGTVVYLIVAGIRLMREPRAFAWPKVTWPEAVAALSVICVLYLTSGWSSTGRTMGKRMMGLRVVGHGGGRLHLGRAFLRAMLCTYFPIGLFWCVVSRRNASVQDLVFGTSVIYDWQSRVVAERDPSGRDPLGSRVDVAPAVADEADDGHAEPVPRADGE
jgi:uncharacterized RDD family membrane protein YckC